MFRGFNIQGLERVNFSLYENKGKEIYRDHKKKLSEEIKKYKDKNGILDAKMISSAWFPKINSDVFISHSHKDHELVLGFAGWLYEEFKLSVFIDAAMWGYADDLLKKIDDVYSLGSSDAKYDYKKRNNSTSHVHMMLTVSLAEMIDQCQAIFFINTPSSINGEDYLGCNSTFSPWIFTEITLMRLIEKKSPRQIALESVALDSSGNSLTVRYPTDLSDLTQLGYDDLIRWNHEFSKNNIESTKYNHALSTLYRMHEEIR